MVCISPAAKDILRCGHGSMIQAAVFSWSIAFEFELTVESELFALVILCSRPANS